MSTVASPKNTKFQIRATDVNNQSVRTPFAKEPIPLRLDFDCHPELARISNWDSELKKHVERACFASYQDQVEMTGRESLPTIRRANQIWKHLSLINI